MDISFVVPAFTRNPIGGFNIMIGYANSLAARGHKATIYFPRDCRPRTSWREYGKALLWYLGALEGRDAAMRLGISSNVEYRFIPRLCGKHLPDADAIITTGWATVSSIVALQPSKGHKYNLIQHYETWDGPADEVKATWMMNIHRIVVAGWLKDMADAFGSPGLTSYIPNPVDHDVFHVQVPMNQRRAARIGMLYHRHEWKGSRDGIAALNLLRGRRPDLEAVLFGVPRRPTSLPGWVEYFQQPSRTELRNLYNSCTIFVQPSHSEGWGLAATEAMACGCALVTHDNGGSRDYAFHLETAMVTPQRTSAAIVDAVDQLLDNAALRRRLAESGRGFVQRFRWQSAAATLERLLTAPDRFRRLPAAVTWDSL